MLPVVGTAPVLLTSAALPDVASRILKDVRVSPHRSTRFEKRGVRRDQLCGAAKLEHGRADQAFGLSEPGVLDRATANSSLRTATGHNRLTRPPRRSPPQEAARGFWIRAWGQREPALQGTGHSNDPAQWPGSLEGGLDVPCPSRPVQLSLHRTPDLDVDAPRFGHPSVDSGSLSFMR